MKKQMYMHGDCYRIIRIFSHDTSELFPPKYNVHMILPRYLMHC